MHDLNLDSPTDVPTIVTTAGQHMGSALDPACGHIGWAAVGLVAADAAHVPDRSAVVGQLGRFGQVAELLGVPGRAVVLMDLRVVDGTVGYTLMFGVADPDPDTARAEAAAAIGAAAEILGAAPTVWRFAPVDPALLLETRTPVRVVRMVQPTVEILDEVAVAVATPRFERRADHGGTLIGLLANHRIGVRVGLIATATDAGDLADLAVQADRAAEIARRHERLPLGRRAVRVHATLLEAGEARLAQVFAAEIVLDGPAGVPDSALRAVAGQLAVGLDVIHLGEHHSVSAPTVAARTRLVGGYELQPADDTTLYGTGLPLPGGTVRPAARDILTTTEAAALLWAPLPAGQALPGIPARQTPEAQSDDGLVVGHRRDGIAVRARFVRPSVHAHLTGATGTGKSVTLGGIVDGLLGEDVTVVLIDSHRSLAARAHTTAARRGLHVRLLTSSATADRLALLPDGTLVPAMELDRAVGRIVSSMSSMWPAEMTGPRWIGAMTAALTALAHIPGAHPTGHVAELLGLVKAGGRLPVLPPAVFHRLRQVVADNDVPGWVASKSDVFAATAVRHVLAEVGDAMPADRMLDADLVCVDLAAADLGTVETRLVGRLLIDSLADAAMARVPGPDNRPVVFVVDEAHAFLGAGLERILVEGRKFGVSLIAAHQNLGQLDPRAARLLADNAAVQVALRSRTDAADRGRLLGVAVADVAGLPDLTGIIATDGNDGPVAHRFTARPPTDSPIVIATDTLDTAGPLVALERLARDACGLREAAMDRSGPVSVPIAICTDGHPAGLPLDRIEEAFRRPVGQVRLVVLHIDGYVGIYDLRGQAVLEDTDLDCDIAVEGSGGWMRDDVVPVTLLAPTPTITARQVAGLFAAPGIAQYSKAVPLIGRADRLRADVAGGDPAHIAAVDLALGEDPPAATRP